MIILFAAALSTAEPAQEEDPAATLAAVQAMYAQSCQVKAYGAYDDLCDALRKQIREAEKTADKAAKHRPAPAPKPIEAAAAQPAPGATAAP